MSSCLLVQRLSKYTVRLWIENFELWRLVAVLQIAEVFTPDILYVEVKYPLAKTGN